MKWALGALGVWGICIVLSLFMRWPEGLEYVYIRVILQGVYFP